MKAITAAILSFLIISGCTTTEVKTLNQFDHDITQGPKPWFGELRQPEPTDFSFAIISDLTGGEREGIFNVAVQQLNQLGPEFVLSVGDLVEGGSEEVAQLEKEWNSFDDRASKLDAPFFHLGGNHDLTNEIMKNFWKERYGPTYYHFLYKDVLFLMLDSEDYEKERMQEIYLARDHAIKVMDGEIEGEYSDTEYFSMPERSHGEMSDDQFGYFQKVLTRYPDVRWTFVLMHKPLWTREDDHGLQRLEESLGTRDYTVINGHQHNFSHRIKNDQDYMILGTTGGSQSKDVDGAFDHLTWVRMTEEEPVISLLRMDGFFDLKGDIPAGGDTLCFQAKNCLSQN
jgi:hypothetical protein